MRRVFSGFTTFIVAASLIGCVAGPPEEAPADGTTQTDHTGMQTAGLHIEATAPLVQTLPSEMAPTAAQEALAQQAEENLCDTVCAVRQWVADERYAEAREVLDAELQDRPEDVETTLLLTSVDLADEEYDAAYARAQASLSSGEQADIRLLERRAQASLRNDDVETAVVDFSDLIDALQSHTDDICGALSGHCAPPLTHEAHAWIGLATAQYNRGEVAAAETIASDVLADSLSEQLDPAHSQFILALTASKRGENELAKAQYNRILRRHPTNPATLNNMGGLYYRDGDLATARTYFLAAYEYAGKHRRTAAIAWSNVAEVDLLEGEYEASEDKLLESLSISKRFAAGHFGLAVLYDVLHRYDDAQEHMTLALALDTQSVTRWNMTWYTVDWEKHFKALVAESENRHDEATALWAQLARCSNELLRDTANRHLSAHQ